MVSYRAVGWSSLLRKWSLVLLLVLLHLLLHFLSWERERQRERGVKNVRFLFVEEESTQNAFAARPLFEKRRRQKRKTSTENKMSTPRYTRPRERTFAAIFGFILAVVVVVIEFLSHSRGVGQSFDTDEIFSRFGATLHFVCKTHILEKKKRLRASKKNGVDANEETLERGRRKASRVPRRAMPSFARLFFSVMVVVLLAKRRYAFLCGVRKLNAKKKIVLGQKTKTTTKRTTTKERKKSKRET